MKRVALLVVAMVLFSTSVFAKELKVGYLDLLSVFNEYTKTKDYEQAIDNKKKEKEKEGQLEVKKDAIVKMQDKLDLLGEQEKEQEKEKIRKAIIEYRDLETGIFNDLKQESDEKMKEILQDVNNIVNDYSKKNGFDLIINKGALVYGIEGADITKDIIKLLNDSYQQKGKKQ